MYFTEFSSQHRSFSKVQDKFKENWKLPCISIAQTSIIRTDNNPETEPSTSRVGRPRIQEFDKLGSTSTYTKGVSASEAYQNSPKVLLRAALTAAIRDGHKGLQKLLSTICNNFDDIDNMVIIKKSENQTKPTKLSEL
jgi:hypothetical protein